MEDNKNDTEELTLQPLPIETDDIEMKGMEEDEVALIPLPIEEPADNAEDTEMKNNEAQTSHVHDQSDAAPQAQPTVLELDHKEEEEAEVAEAAPEVMEEEAEEEGGIVEEQEEEEGGIIEEEEEDGGQVLGHSNESDAKEAAQTQSQSQSQSQSHTASQPKPQPKSASKEQKEKEDADKDRPKWHQITTTQPEQRFLNIHLMKEWTNGEVLQWLTHRFGLWGQQYVPAFSNRKVDGQQLSQLSKEELKTEFGVTKPLHLVRICRDIEDAARPLRHINKLIQPCYVDGGNAASKLMRFSPKEVHEFANQLTDLKPYAKHFLDRQINGRVLLEASDVQLVAAMKDESITLVHAQSIVENIDRIKHEERLDRKTATEADYAPIKAVYEVWSKTCKINEMRFKLLPQHIRDWSKPAPTYQPPPAYQHAYGQNAAYQHHQPVAARAATHAQPATYGVHQAYQRQEVQPRNRVPPMHEVKNIMEWTTEDCVNWLGQIESKVDLRVRYTPHFEQIKMSGPVLLNMTPSTLSSVCCITTKTHLKVLVKAIDRIRDHMVFGGFAQLPHVKEFTRKYGGGFNFPPIQQYDAAAAVAYQPEPKQVVQVQPVQAMVSGGGAGGGGGTSGSDADSVDTKTGQPRRMTLEEQRALAQPSAKAQANIDAGEIRKRRKRGGGDGTEKTVTAGGVKSDDDDSKQEELQQKSPQSAAAAAAACFVCGKTGNVMRCSQCKSAFYCSREHQVNDWSRHSKECNK
eukprot:CAMPEP_0197027988 /NCGR_PEP_ID=MMETSP1384-20130603/7815_1 /TAXON_ID=29189 /ORGANISM="Ammonia sp." /LENGTH=744 /DNA_ID=CAMNT_0042456923 /DNA_START=89 /DNA_END=2323 /DNA_ORIENTATION=-